MWWVTLITSWSICPFEIPQCGHESWTWKFSIVQLNYAQEAHNPCHQVGGWIWDSWSGCYPSFSHNAIHRHLVTWFILTFHNCSSSPSTTAVLTWLWSTSRLQISKFIMILFSLPSLIQGPLPNAHGKAWGPVLMIQENRNLDQEDISPPKASSWVGSRSSCAYQKISSPETSRHFKPIYHILVNMEIDFHLS